MNTRYSSNNSGGSWWLTDDDWRALEAAGWRVDWVKDNPDGAYMLDEQGRWLGALAVSASRELPEAEAIAEWERVTGEDATAEGCECCGTPHSFWERA